jgi:hypothetical protein
MVKVYSPRIRVEFKGVRLKSPDVDLQTGLMKPKALFWVRNAIDSRKAYEQIRTEVSVDGTEIVEWMHYATAINAVFEAMADEYSRAGSGLLYTSGDAYEPGVSLGSLRALSEPADVITRRGHGILTTPYGDFKVPCNGKLTIATKDLLAWAAIPFTAFKQWCMAILRWTDLAEAPISDRIRFGSSYGLVAPNFFKVGPRAPLPFNIMKIGVTTDKPQTMKIKGRGLPGKGSVDEVLFEDEIELDAGQNEFTYYYWGFPVAPTITLELQPEDNTETVLDYIDLIP